MLRAATGTPMRMIDLAKRPLALAEPEPFTLANLTTKSLTAASGAGFMLLACVTVSAGMRVPPA